MGPWGGTGLIVLEVIGCSVDAPAGAVCAAQVEQVGWSAVAMAEGPATAVDSVRPTGRRLVPRVGWGSGWAGGQGSGLAELLAAWAARAGGRLRGGSPRAFLATTVGTFVLGVLGLLVFSWYVNPWGDFGRTGYQELYNARLAKADYLDSLPRGQLPQALVLGSSNTMSYSPTTIKDELGLSAFNFGVFWGRSEDALCVVRHVVEDLQHRPELLIIGVDTWTFGPVEREHPVFPGMRRRLLNTPQLIRHHPDVNPVQHVWATVIDAFSRQQLEMSWKLVRRGAVRREAPGLVESGFFAADGSRTWFGDPFGVDGNIFPAVEGGSYPITAKLRQAVAAGDLSLIGPLQEFYCFADFNQDRVTYMEELLALCQGAGIRVVFAINPLHPVLVERLARESRHQENVEQLRHLLDRFACKYCVVAGTVDASRIELIGGDPDGFFDAFHPAQRNCDLIIERIARMLEAQ